MNLKNLNTAESISLARIISFPLILLVILLEKRNFSAWLYIIFFSTDFIDGFFAFFYNQESSRRAILDTLGDILLLIAGMVGFYIFETEFFSQHLFPIAIVLGLYVLQLVLALLKWGQPSSFHTYTAKLAAIAQVIFLAFTLLFEASVVLFYLAFIMSIIDAIEEILLTLLLRNWKANIKGLVWYWKDKSSASENHGG